MSDADRNLALFERFVSLNRRRLVQVAAKYVGAANAEDIAQEALVRALRALHGFDPSRDNAMRRWLERIVRNCAFDFTRRQKVRGTCPLDLVIEPVECDTYPVEQVNYDVILAELKPAQRRALRMLADGLTYRDIATEMGIPVGSVRSLIHRSRRRVAELLGESEETL